MVEIDECMLKGKRKYNLGRMVAPAQWVFDACDLRSGQGMVWLVADRKGETPLPLIKHHICPVPSSTQTGLLSIASFNMKASIKWSSTRRSSPPSSMAS